MTTNSAALKRDGVRANNRPSISDENFRRLVTAAIRETRTSIRRDGGDSYDVVMWLADYLRSHNVTSKVQAGSIVLPSGKIEVEHYWLTSNGALVDPTIDKFRNELSLDIGYFMTLDDVPMLTRYVEQKYTDEDKQRSFAMKRAKRNSL